MAEKPVCKLCDGTGEVTGTIIGCPACIASKAAEKMLKLLNCCGHSRKCHARGCDTTVWFLATKRGARMIYEADGTPHWGNCKEAADFRRRKL